MWASPGQLMRSVTRKRQLSFVFIFNCSSIMTHSPSICLRISVLPQTMYTLSRTDISPNKLSPAVSGKHVLMSALQIHLTMRCWHRHTEEKCLQLWVCWPPEFRRFPELDQAGCLHIQHPVFLRQTHFCQNIPFPADHNRHALCLRGFYRVCTKTKNSPKQVWIIQ